MNILTVILFVLCGLYSVESDCQPEWYNHCKEDKDCCSGFCDRPPEWEFGVCKMAETKCLQSRAAGCNKTPCCKSLQCFFGRNSSWTLGLCVDEKLMDSINEAIDISESDNEKKLVEDAYSKYVNDALIDQSDIRFQTEKVKCRDLDPMGSYFYKVDTEYSFRVCDACVEVPILKIYAIRIDEEPIETIDSTAYLHKCFEQCIENGMCVAFSLNSKLNQCHLYGTVNGKFKENEDWDSYVLTQPTGNLRDYVMSRNTGFQCPKNITVKSHENNTLDCFEKCNEIHCDYASYNGSAGECEIVEDAEPCDRTYFSYGRNAIFKRSFFNDAIYWRFNGTGPESIVGNIDEDSSTVTLASKVGSAGSAPTPEKQRQLKNAMNDEFFVECQSRCLNVSTCIALQYNSQNYDCKLVDLMNWNSLAYPLPINYTAVYVTHPFRNSPTYGFSTQRIASYSNINYNTKSTQAKVTDCMERCKENEQCRDVLYNYADQTCLTNDLWIGPNRLRVTDKDKWVMLSKNRPAFNQPEFKFTVIGRNKRLAVKHDQYITSKQTLSSDDQHGYKTCLMSCLKKDRNDLCNLVQVERTPKSINCKFYSINLFNETINSDDVLFSDLYLFTSNQTFSQQELDEWPIMSEDDAYQCEINKVDSLIDSLYLTAVEQLSNQTALSTRVKRSIFDKIGNFFKGIGKAVVDTVKNVGKTIVGGVKAVGKLVTGDAKGALKEIKETPLYKEGENLVKSVKTVGEGIVKGDLKKIGEGVLGVATNDLLGFIPGQKALSIGAKAIKSGVKGVVKGTAKKDAKKDAKSPKDDVADNNFKKEQTKKEKEKEQQCKANNRPKRALGKRKRGQCAPDECDQPEFVTGSGNNLIKSSTKACKGTKVDKHCFYLCNAGYDEKPERLVCRSRDTWSAKASCEPQVCEASGLDKSLIIVKSSTIQSVLDNRANDNKEIPLYLVLYDNSRKTPIYSVAYYKFALTSGKFTKRTDNFRPHPCTRLTNKQATDADYSTNNPFKYQRGHLTPFNLFRWNEKTRNSGNLLVNVAPQGGPFNEGTWRILELAVQCASSKKIYAVVATGVAGNANQMIGLRRDIPVPKYYWKMVCYRDRRSTATHVALFVGENIHGPETDATKKFAFTPRSQSELSKFDPTILATNNPWRHVLKIKDNFFRVAMYPTPVECAAALTLSADQVTKWKGNFKIFDKRKKRDTGGEAFCSKADLDSFIDEFGGPGGIGSDGNGGDDPGDPENVNIPAASCNKRIVGYYTSWGKTSIKASTVSRFTHIIFAFFEMRSDGTVGIGNPDHSSAQTDSDEEVSKQAKKNLGNLMKIREKLPNLKVSFAVGGWENSQYFSAMAASSSMKQNFIASVLRAIDEYDFDGVDIDWEYPVTGGAHEGIPEDKQNYVSLMRDLRNVFDAKERGRYLISFASAAGEDALKSGYDLPGLLKYANWVNVMTYDFFGPWESKWGAYTGPPAPLYHNVPKGYSGKFNVNWAIKQYACDLTSPEQVVMGIPLYGRYWNNVPDKQGPYAMYRMAKSANGKFTGGFASWRDIKSNWLTDPNFKSYFDDVVKSPYAYNANGTYLGYESPESVKFKVEFAIKSNLGGLMVWAIDQDDDQHSMIDQISKASLCTNSNAVNFKCIPIKDRRWWTLTDGEELGGLCGKSAPLFRGYYPVCDPDDLGYSCCGSFGYCGSDKDFCDCPTCVNYAVDPNKILEEPIKPTTSRMTWYFSNAPDGKRGRCGRTVPKKDGAYATCNPDDPNAHCCSNGGYCGQGQASCKCSGCVDFKEKPNYSFPPKTWWDWGDGAGKSGRCGPKAPKLPEGGEAGCDPDSEKDFCCSANGFCGSGDKFCKCSGCKNYKK